MKNKSIGQTLLDLEVILDEMVDLHELQAGDILNLVRGQLETHNPNCFEEYTDDDSSPLFFYGPRK